MNSNSSGGRNNCSKSNNRNSYAPNARVIIEHHSTSNPS